MDERCGCTEIRELLPEVAARVAAGDERARALAHLSGCVGCRQELDALSMVVDEFLTLAPEVQPPAAFESVVLARAVPAPRRWWQSRQLQVAAAVVLAAAVGVGATLQASADDRRVAGQYREILRIAGGRFLTARPLATPGGSRAGRVFAYQGAPSWVFVVVAYGQATGAYQVFLATRDGVNRMIGEVEVVGGAGSWGIAIDADVAQVAEVRLAGAAGPPLTAVFR
jgi:Putative zinc-finger